MNAAQQRKLLRYLHLVVGGLIGTYIYSPWGSDPTFALVVKVGILPVLGMSGLLMWQQARLRKLLTA